MFAALSVMVVVTLRRLEHYVGCCSGYDEVLTLQWDNPPQWLANGPNPHVLDDLTEAAGLRIDDRPLDPGLTQRIGQSLAATHSAWVAKLERVDLRPGGIIGIRCRFRRPTAWVRRGDDMYLIGDDGVRLPGLRTVAEAADSDLITIDGSSGAVPEPGEHWHSPDVLAGLQIARACENHPFRTQIKQVLVGNYHGRLDRLRPHIELATDRPDGRILWGRAPGEEDGCEISAVQKVALLQSLYEQEGRVDMNRPYVNVTIWPDRISLPSGAGVLASSNPRRG